MQPSIEKLSTEQKLPATGFLRIRQIVGDPKAKPSIPAIIPVSKSTWWAGIQEGRYPQPVKIGLRATAWRVEDIRALIEKLSSQGTDKKNAAKPCALSKGKVGAHV